MTEYDSNESSLDDFRGNVDMSDVVTDEGNGKYSTSIRIKNRKKFSFDIQNNYYFCKSF